MNNKERYNDIKSGYLEFINTIEQLLERAKSSSNESITTLHRMILADQARPLSQINNANNTIDTIIAEYLGINPALLSDDFLSDTTPEMTRFIGEKLDKAKEYLEELTATDFATESEQTQSIFEAHFGKASAVFGAQLNLVGAMLQSIDRASKWNSNTLPQNNKTQPSPWSINAP